MIWTSLPRTSHVLRLRSSVLEAPQHQQLTPPPGILRFQTTLDVDAGYLAVRPSVLVFPHVTAATISVSKANLTKPCPS